MIVGILSALCGPKTLTLGSKQIQKEKRKIKTQEREPQTAMYCNCNEEDTVLFPTLRVWGC